MALRLYNTLSRRKEDFEPIEPGKVRMYTCGPTVYNYAHIGNLRSYIFADILRRTLQYNGYEVPQVMNVTDVGHLTSDQDLGEDKMELEAKKTGKDIWEIARYFESVFFRDLDRLNIQQPAVRCRATEHIADMIELVRSLFRARPRVRNGSGGLFRRDDFSGVYKALQAVAGRQNNRRPR